MKQGFGLAAIFAICLMPTVRAEEGSERSQGASRNLIRELIEKFDRNGDGKLTGEEREAARRALAERRERGERGEREGERPRSEADGPRREGDRPAGEGDRPRAEGDQPRREGDRPRGEGDRPRTEGDRPAGEGDKSAGDRQPTREEILAKFDEDGNGKLEGTELVKAQADARRRREAARERENASRPEQSGIRLTIDQQRLLRREFDRNRDGQLTGEERERALRFAREKWGSGSGERREGDRREGGERPGPGGGDRREGGERRGPGGGGPPRPPR